MADAAPLAGPTSAEPTAKPTGRFSARAAAAAEAAAGAAAEVDRYARLPVEAVTELRAQRLLGIQVPAVEGGEDASFQELGEICFALARACASTAMIFAMHQIQVGCLVRHGGDHPWQTAARRRLATEQLLIAGSTTEGATGGGTRESVCAFETAGDGLSVEKAGAVVSYGPHADGVLVTARRDANAAPGNQAVALFFRPDIGLEETSPWDALGMRGTCSAAYRLTAKGGADQMLADSFTAVHPQTMLPLAHLLWGSVWAGVAADAVERARQTARKSLRAGDAGAPAVLQAAAAAERYLVLRALLVSGFASFTSRASEPARLVDPAFQAEMNLLKISASELALEVTLTALRATGFAGYRNDSTVSVTRHLRDALSSLVMISNDRVRLGAAPSVLLSPVPDLTFS